MRVPYAWNNTFQNKKRTLAAVAGITFSVPILAVLRTPHRTFFIISLLCILTGNGLVLPSLHQEHL